MDRNELKIQALLERISNLTANYENQVAELRVDLTLVTRDKEQLQEQFNSLQNDTEQPDVAQEDPAAADNSN